MPYIKKERRAELSNPNEGAITPGELNYKITMLCKGYVAAHGLSYASINDVVGALVGARLEFYRRVVAPYEDKKIIENGDVC